MITILINTTVEIVIEAVVNLDYVALPNGNKPGMKCGKRQDNVWVDSNWEEQLELVSCSVSISSFLGTCGTQFRMESQCKWH